MIEKKHSPLPWTYARFPTGVVEGILVSGKDEIGLLYATDGMDESKSFPAEANAEFIVRACNAHEELVMALQRARKLAWTAVRLGVDLPEFNPDDHAAIQEIDAALAKAEAS